MCFHCLLKWTVGVAVKCGFCMSQSQHNTRFDIKKFNSIRLFERMLETLIQNHFCISNTFSDETIEFVTLSNRFNEKHKQYLSDNFRCEKAKILNIFHQGELISCHNTDAMQL